MSGAKEYLQVKFLKTLEPLGSLSVDKLEEIANKSQVEELPPGRVVFRQGEKDNRSTYLLSGQLELQVTGNPRAEVLKAKSVESRYPVAQEWPRPSTCRAKTNAVLLHIDSNLLEILLTDDPSGAYEVTEIGVNEDPESDWMLRFLQSPAFLQLPTANIQSILVQLEEVPAPAGKVIIKQGDTNDWYYIVKSGKCSVSRRPAPKAEEVRLAILGPGDGFGEEALITDGKRNATVTMKEAGVLMRLNKSDFHNLLVEPMLQEVDHATMTDKVKAGAALIDVRTNKEFNENGIKSAQNIPLSMLRVKAKDLNKTREHIVYCNDTTQSRAAAFLLAQQSLQVYVLEGGLSKQSKPFSPAQPVATSTPTAAAIPVVNEIHHDAEVSKPAFTTSGRLSEQADALRAQANNLARKTSNAEEIKRKAEEGKRAAQAEIDTLKKETLKERNEILASVKQEAKKKEDEAIQLRTEANQARQRAEQELARIKADAANVAKQQSELDSEFKRAESTNRQAEQAAEVARIMAQQEAEKVKNEAERIRQKAFEEAQRISSELEARKARIAEEEALHKKTSLKEARRQADLSVAEATKAAEDARRQAALEADAIRKQALKEAENLRSQLEREKQQAAEQVARSKAEDQLRRQELETERQKTIDEARQKAELDADNIRKRAVQEAQIKAREEARHHAEAEAEAVRNKAIEETEALRKKMIEDFTQKAMETAQLEAESIRREALEEANRLRAEMEQTRAMVENHAKLAQEQIEENSARRFTEENEHARAAEEAARLAEETSRRRSQQAEQAQRAEDEAMAIAEEQARIAAQVEQQRIAEEQARLSAQVEQQRIAEEQAQASQQAEQQRVTAERSHKAKLMAEQLRGKLDKQETANQFDEYQLDIGRGPKLAKAKLHVVKNKTILEGEEDIFIFKAPSERPPSRDEAEELLKNAEKQFSDQSSKELPSFDIEYADDDEPASEFVIEQASEFSDSILVELDNITTNSAPAPRSQQFDDDFIPGGDKSTSSTKKKRSSLIALAASVVVMVTVSVVAITRPTYMDAENLAVAERDAQPTRGLAAMRTRTGNHKKIIEERMKSEAEAEFDQMLADFRVNKR